LGIYCTDRAQWILIQIRDLTTRTTEIILVTAHIDCVPIFTASTENL